MAPTSSPETVAAAEHELLLDVARRSIEHGLWQGRALPVDPADYPEALRPLGATFVTLKRQGQLRGCIGELEARYPLIVSVAEMAFRSAFHDPRFQALKEEELADLEIEISVLSPLEALAVASEDELLEQLRPGVDGLVLRDGGHQATYLPSVWESLREPRRFVAELKRKAGLAASHWSPGLEVSRFTVQSIA